jgi:pyruvate formate-lyase/glycerol dehydratase family glycyl radical enzyme
VIRFNEDFRLASELKIKRTIKLKNNLLSSPNYLCIERAKFFTEIYKNNKELPEIIKKAKAISHTLRNMTIFIRDDELLVGNETSKNLGEKLTFELHSFKGFTDKESLKQLRTRKPQPFQMSDNDIEKLNEIIPFWKGKSLFGDIIYRRMQDEKMLLRDDNTAASAPNIAVMTGTNEGHLCAGYEKLLKLGYIGIIKEAEHFQEQLKRSDPEYTEKHEFYEAVKIYYNSAIEFALRYSDLADKMSEKEENLNRKNQLISIADCMKNLSENPPNSFYEAMECIWFTQNIANIIYYRSVLALGRLDQILWPYYQKDIELGIITKDFALELIEELNLKLTWNCTLLPTNYTAAANALGLNTQTITISGVNENGLDATNELSYLFLETYKNIKSLTSDLSVRIHENTPKKFFLEALKVFRSTSGIAFYNDDVIIPALTNAGYTLEDARNYVLIGCVEPTSQGNTFAATGHMFINLPGVLELTLNNGLSHFSGQIDGLQTGDPESFITYEEFYDAFKRQLQFNIEKAAKIANLMDEEAMKWCEQPFISATLDGCMERGKDYTQGGAKYNFSSITAFSFASLVNSLYNIKKIVYTMKLMTLSEFVNILNSNFKKQNVFRKELLNKYPKWGNDQEEIDAMAVDLWDLYCQEVVMHKPIRGGRFNPGAYSMGIHVLEGLITVASADGRKSFQPLSNSLSPSNQTEKNGVTAALNSIAKLNYNLATNGVAVNMRFHPQNLEGEKNLENFYFLLNTYFDKGGMQIQPTVVSTETLKDAQAHPENYPDLIVKVGGYNATFVDLGTAIQNDIIDRLEINL